MYDRRRNENRLVRFFDAPEIAVLILGFSLHWYSSHIVRVRNTEIGHQLIKSTVIRTSSSGTS